MDHRLLTAFSVVADCGHYGRAAERLSISQPALTKQVQALEAQLGGPLFERGRHGAVPTALGRALLPEVRELLHRDAELARRARRLARGEAGRLSVGFGLSSITVAPRAVAAFRARYPDVEIDLDDMASRVQVERLLAGELQVGFVRLPCPAALDRLVLHRDHLVLAMPADGGEPPDGVDAVVAWLSGHRLVGLNRAKGPGLFAQIAHFGTACGVELDTAQRTSDLQTVLALVAAGAGAALVPAGAAAIAGPAVRFVHIEHEAAVWEVATVWNPAAPAPAVANFVEVVREVTGTAAH